MSTFLSFLRKYGGRLSAGIAVAALLGAIVLCAVESVHPLRKGVAAILGCLAVSCMAAAPLLKDGIGKYTLILCYSLLLPLAGLELYYTNVLSQKNYDPFAPGPHQDRALGYRLVPGITQAERKDPAIGSAGTVTATVNRERRRIAFPAPQADTAVALFGCSFTYGHLLSDEETAAWLVGEQGQGKIQVFNYGTPGWGTHQVYTLIRQGLPELAGYKEVYAFYISIVDHSRRVSGLVAHDRLGPRFFVRDGKLVQAGTLSSPLFPCPPALHRMLLKSKLYQRMLSLKFTLAEQIAVTRALILESERSLKKQLPNLRFAVIEWPYIRPRKQSLRSEWREMLDSLRPEIPVYYVEDWLPQYAERFENYHIAGDTHPNALANRIVAEHILALLRADAGGAGIERNVTPEQAGAQGQR